MLDNIFDSHSHYTDKAFEPDRDELLSRLPQMGVSNIVTVGSSLEDSQECIKIAENYDYIFSACGVHPESEASTPDGFTNDLEKLLKSSLKVRALGEIGLDYHYENYDRKRQMMLFTQQLELAKSLNLPVIVHSRNATEDTMNILRKYHPAGVVHCFSGSAETAKEVISLGMYIGFTGVLTFKNAQKALKALAEVPLDRLLLETDCPYMAPEPFRGQRCDSSMISQTAAAAAQVKAVSVQELLDITSENARRFFKLS